MTGKVPKTYTEDGEDTEITRVTAGRDSTPSHVGQVHAYLVVLSGSNVGEMHRLGEHEIVIGRSSDAQIRLTDNGISRRHARVIQTNEGVVLEDMGSANGTMVNTTRVTRAVLKDGDKIKMGTMTVLKFTYHDRLDESFQQQMYEAAVRDGLTRAYNKKYFVERFETEFAYARRHRVPLSLLMIDVDHFKGINDRHGHIAGDQVLVRLSRLILGTIRTEDVFARYGGEEFAIICRGISPANALVLGERIRVVVQSTPMDTDSGKIPVTVSVGIAGLPEASAASATQLVTTADEALYEAKRLGRNRSRVKA